MKETRCDFCNKVIDENKSRIKGSIQIVNNEKGDSLRHLVWESMDFCDADCFASFLHNKIKESGELS